MENRLIPTTIEEITTEWLTGALTKSGVLKNNSVRTLNRKIMGEGMGYAGTLARLSIEYEQPDDMLPSTMIAKIPTQVPKSKMLHKALWNYERENHVYEEILPHLPLRTPQFYYSDFDRGKGEKWYTFMVDYHRGDRGGKRSQCHQVAGSPFGPDEARH
jgi:hypothetical protein